MRSFAVILLAAAVFAAPKVDPKKQDKRSVLTGDIGGGVSSYAVPSYGLGNYGLGNYGLANYDLSNYAVPSLGLSGYSSGHGAKLLAGSGLSELSVGNNLLTAYESGLGYGTPGGVLVGRGDFVAGSGLGHASVLPASTIGHHAKSERITGITLHREVQVPVPVPHPVPVEITKHVPVPQPVPVKVDRPYPVAVPQPVPVEVTRHVPVKVDRPYPVPVPHPVEVRVPQPIAVPVAQPVPVPVSVTRHVPVSVSSVVPSALSVVPSTLGVVPSSSAGFISSGLATGHEYADLGSFSGASLESAFGSGYESGAIVIPGGNSGSGSSSSGSFLNGGLGSTLLTHDVASVPLKQTILKTW